MRGYCLSCLYYDNSTGPAEHGDEYGACRRNPPQVGINLVLGVWPYVGDDDWCGGYEPDVTEEKEG